MTRTRDAQDVYATIRRLSYGSKIVGTYRESRDLNLKFS